jgi:hypothetical protein
VATVVLIIIIAIIKITVMVTLQYFKKGFKLHTCHPVPGGYKYGNLALQVGGVSDETVKYVREFCGTSTQE